MSRHHLMCTSLLMHLPSCLEADLEPSIYTRTQPPTSTIHCTRLVKLILLLLVITVPAASRLVAAALIAYCVYSYYRSGVSALTALP